MMLRSHVMNTSRVFSKTKVNLENDRKLCQAKLDNNQIKLRDTTKKIEEVNLSSSKLVRIE